MCVTCSFFTVVAINKVIFNKHVEYNYNNPHVLIVAQIDAFLKLLCVRYVWLKNTHFIVYKSKSVNKGIKYSIHIISIAAWLYSDSNLEKKKFGIPEGENMEDYKMLLNHLIAFPHNLVEGLADIEQCPLLVHFCKDLARNDIVQYLNCTCWKYSATFLTWKLRTPDWFSS